MNLMNKEIDSGQRRDFLSGMVFLVIGILTILLAIQHPIWTISGPGEGFFPLLTGLIIIGSSLVVMTPTLRIYIRQEEARKAVNAEQQESTDMFKVFSYGILMILYGISFEAVGFLMDTVVFLVLILKFVERRGWASSLLYAFSVTIVSYVLFAYLLSVNLPKGLIRWF